jgi:dihydropteroate synthase
MVPPGVGVSTLVMGVVNVTPDSFSDGGEWFEPDAAVAHGLELLDQGADLLDVGGESTRPGAERPTQDEELRRVLPVVTTLAGRGARISVDTMRAEVAAQALAAGASVVNDVSGGLADPDMAAVVAGSGATYVAMHWRAHSTRMQSLATYDDVVQDVCRELTQRVEALGAAGVRAEQIVLDPGFGFAKLAAHNWRLLAHLDRVQALGFPVLVGTSRKSFLGRLGVPPGDPPRPATQRDPATAATTVLAGLAGAWGVRVHHVPSSVDALRVVAATEQAR